MTTLDRSRAVPDDGLNHPHTLEAFGNIRRLICGYLGISVITLAAIVLLRTTRRR